MTIHDAVHAQVGDIMLHTKHTNADGSPVRFKVTGKVKLWKRTPEKFRLPVKHGIYVHGYIDETNCSEFKPQIVKVYGFPAPSKPEAIAWLGKQIINIEESEIAGSEVAAMQCCLNMLMWSEESHRAVVEFLNSNYERLVK
jgi:hypothetical protein